jgi:O-acetylhomoserine/O-acetylserine sulfhydrylase-like pyridoxal-dependent enzyme
MSIIQTQTTSFKAELYQAIHNLLTDTLKIALYTGDATLNADTTAYSTTNEITGTGYTAGGVVITGVTVNSSGYTAYVSFNNPSWPAASFTTRAALIYNSSKANRSIAVLDFGADKTVSGNTFTITLPTNNVTDALIRSSN